MRTLGKETVREEIEFIPAQVKLLRYIRYSYVCDVKAGVKVPKIAG
jgi:hypothetical protein